MFPIVSSVVTSTLARQLILPFRLTLLVRLVLLQIITKPTDLLPSIGPDLYLNTVSSAVGGKLAVSVNGGREEVIDMRSVDSTSRCDTYSLGSGVLFRRSIRVHVRDNGEAENFCSGKVIDGQTAVDSASYVYPLRH
jgi:hypothetical protein